LRVFSEELAARIRKYGGDPAFFGGGA